MSTSGGIDRTGASIAPQDFFRTPAPANELPNGVNDTTEGISRPGKVMLGSTIDPVATIDVTNGNRSGADPRIAGTAAYTTGNLAAMPVYNAADLPTPACVAEVRHNNQGQGIGFAYNGIYATGSIVNQDFGLLNRGAGTHWKGWQAANGVQYLNDHYGGAALAVNMSFTARYYVRGAELSQDYVYVERVGPNFVRRQWDITINNGRYEGMRLRPVNTVAGTEGVELYIDGNRIQRRKLVLFDQGVGSDNFFGFGMAGGTLTYQVPFNTTAHAHAWYGGADQRMALFGNGQLRLHADQQAAAPATDVPLFRDPATGNIRQGAAGSSTRKFRVVQALAAGSNVITHNLGVAAVMVDVRDNASGAIVAASVTAEAANTTTITVGAPVASARITIIG